jgi:integrase
MARPQGKGYQVRGASIRFTCLPDGKRPTMMIGGEVAKPTKANIERAARLARQYRDEIKFGTFNYAEHFGGDTAGAPLLLVDWLRQWLDAQAIEDSTRHGYETAIGFWAKQWPARAVRSIRHIDVLTVLAKSKANYSGKTMNNYLGVLRPAMRLALREGLIASNPMIDVKKQAWQRDPPDPFTFEETERIIAHAYRHHHEAEAAMIEWRFFSGVRTSEMVGLKWQHVDLGARVTKIREAIVSGEEKQTKTNTARDVKMNTRAFAALQRQRKHTQMQSEYVWLDPVTLNPWRQESVFRRRVWEPTLKALGIRYRAPNNMRHSYATRLLMAGVRPKFAAIQMGHDVEVFLRTYATWLPGEADDIEMRRLEDSMDAGNGKERGTK